MEDMIEEPDNIKDSPYSTSMKILKVHKAKRVITRQGFHCVQLFSIATDEESFHDQWYRKADGTESCGHFDLVESHEIDTNCAKCFEGENGTDWIQCPRCCQWFHELGCFYV